jgi:hypothetical protein
MDLLIVADGEFRIGTLGHPSGPAQSRGGHGDTRPQLGLSGRGMKIKIGDGHDDLLGHLLAAGAKGGRARKHEQRGGKKGTEHGNRLWPSNPSQQTGAPPQLDLSPGRAPGDWLVQE